MESGNLPSSLGIIIGSVILGVLVLAGLIISALMLSLFS